MSPFQDHLLEHIQIFILKLLLELLLHHYVLFMYSLVDGSTSLGRCGHRAPAFSVYSAVFSRNVAWLENCWNSLTVGQISMTSVAIDQEKE